MGSGNIRGTFDQPMGAPHIWCTPWAVIMLKYWCELSAVGRKSSLDNTSKAAKMPTLPRKSNCSSRFGCLNADFSEFSCNGRTSITRRQRFGPFFGTVYLTRLAFLSYVDIQLYLFLECLHLQFSSSFLFIIVFLEC